MARTDLNHSNGWIPEQVGPVLQTVEQTSVIESSARKVNMTTDQMRIPSLDGADPRIVAEGEVFPEAALTLSDQQLIVSKYGEIIAISREDVEDSDGSFLEEYKKNWFRNWAVKFDNAALGVATGRGTTAGTLKDRPFDSVYSVAKANSAVAETAGALKLEMLSDALGDLEVSNFFSAANGIIIAHPSLKASLRVLKDAAGNPVFNAGQAIAGGVGDTLFGYEVKYSLGARVSAAQSSAPTGNPLLIVGARDYLVNGVRSGPESQLSTEVDFKSDVYNLKVQARRGFKVTEKSAFSVVEITAGP